jgi:hypothetical protein
MGDADKAFPFFLIGTKNQGTNLKRGDQKNV